MKDWRLVPQDELAIQFEQLHIERFQSFGVPEGNFRIYSSKFLVIVDYGTLTRRDYYGRSGAQEIPFGAVGFAHFIKDENAYWQLKHIGKNGEDRSYDPDKYHTLPFSGPSVIHINFYEDVWSKDLKTIEPKRVKSFSVWTGLDNRVVRIKTDSNALVNSLDFSDIGMSLMPSAKLKIGGLVLAHTTANGTQFESVRSEDNITTITRIDPDETVRDILIIPPFDPDRIAEVLAPKRIFSVPLETPPINDKFWLDVDLLQVCGIEWMRYPSTAEKKAFAELFRLPSDQ